MQFDSKITLGNLLTIITMVSAVAVAYFDLNTKVAVISTAQAYQATADAEGYKRLEKKVDWIIDLFIKQQEPKVPRNN